MKKLAIGFAAIVLAATALPAAAQTGRTEHREWRQQERIWRGAVRGDLTPRELRNLQRQQQRIDRTQARAARDGYISPRERAKLERQQDRANRTIARKTHNGRFYY